MQGLIKFGSEVQVCVPIFDAVILFPNFSRGSVIIDLTFQFIGY